jgi:hypothetical protein
MWNKPSDPFKRSRFRLIIAVIILFGLIIGVAVPWGRTSSKVNGGLDKAASRIGIITPPSSSSKTSAKQAQAQRDKEACTTVDPLLTSTTGLTDAVKEAASNTLKACQTPMISELNTRYQTIQETRRSWYTWGLLVVLPLAGFIGFMIFPYFMRNTIRGRIPDVSGRRLFRLYLGQAMLVAVLLLALGGCLWLTQYWLSSLGAKANPQMILQEEEINYVGNNHTRLIRKYPEIYVPVARELTALPDEAMLSLIIESGLEQRDDTTLGLEADLINFTWPTFSFLFFATFGLLIFLFLQRTWPEIKNMLRYPVELLAAEYEGRLPEISIQQTTKKLLVVELKVLGAFFGLAIGLSFLTSFFLQIFFGRVIQLLIENISGGMTYFVRQDGAAWVIVVATFLILVFLTESVLLFMLAFATIIGKITDCLRERYNGLVSKNASRKLVQRHFANFLRVIGLAVILSLSLSLGATFLTSALTEPDKPMWVLTLLGVPTLLLVGFNLGMWLLGGFKGFQRLLPDMFNPNARENKQRIIQMVDAGYKVPVFDPKIPVYSPANSSLNPPVSPLEANRLEQEVPRELLRQERRSRRGR